MQVRCSDHAGGSELSEALIRIPNRADREGAMPDSIDHRSLDVEIVPQHFQIFLG
jgi:hypothetical protein